MQKNKNKPGYKKTKVGWIPEDWKCCRLGDVFEKRNAHGTDEAPVFSVSQEHGLVPRGSLERRVESNLSASDSLLVEPGDIAYNMMRMWQGAVAVSRETCIVSPAYVVCRPVPDYCNSDFMLLFFKSRLGLNKLWSYSYGIVDDRLRLYFKDFALVPAPLPSLPEQEAIAEVLECWDKAIRVYEQKIEKKRNIKKGLMRHLLTGRRRLPDFDSALGAGNSEVIIPEGWKEVRLSDIVSIAYGKDWKDVKSLSGGVAVFGTGGLMGYASKALFQPPAILLGRKGTIDSPIFIDEPFWAVDTTFAIHAVVDIDMLFLHNLLKTIHWHQYNEASGVPSLSRETIQGIHIKLPCLAEQQAIAAVLSTADGEITTLERKLAAL
ncbi:MAG: restriction endonuclease subunit S, partial [Desulfobacterales bacterium]